MMGNVYLCQASILFLQPKRATKMLSFYACSPHPSPPSVLCPRVVMTPLHTPLPLLQGLLLNWFFCHLKHAFYSFFSLLSLSLSVSRYRFLFLLLARAKSSHFFFFLGMCNDDNVLNSLEIQTPIQANDTRNR